MRSLVIGSGMMGSALALDLSRSAEVQALTLADCDIERARAAAARLGTQNVRAVALDVGYYDDVAELMRSHDCAVGATSFRHNILLTRAAIEAGIHFCDLGGNDEVVREQLKLDAIARDHGVLVIPNCGLAPGLANVLAARGAEYFESVDAIYLRVGGVPLHPIPPLNYQLVFSVEGLINEYTGRAVVLRNGRVTQVETLTEIETIEFPPPFGTMEAFHTSGGASLLPTIFEGRVRELDYKTIRYPGHGERFKALLDLGFASDEPITVGSALLTAREIFHELLKKRLTGDGRDAVLLRVRIVGVREHAVRELCFDLIDSFDENDNITAMMRTTAFPTSVIAQLIVNGTIERRGVATPEQCVPLQPLLNELRARGIDVKERWRPLTTNERVASC